MKTVATKMPRKGSILL